MRTPRVPAPVRRYLLAEVVGTAFLVVAAHVAQRSWDLPIWGLTLLVVVAESAGFYAVMALRIVREQRTLLLRGPGRARRLAVRTVALMAAEFGPAELLDAVTRPAITWVVIGQLGTSTPALLVAKVAADVAYYAVAFTGYRLTRHLGWREPRRRPPADPEPQPGGDPTLRARRVAETRALLARPAVCDARMHTPALVLDVESVRQAYRRFTTALPFVGVRYAVKALDHPSVLRTLAAEGAGFDVAGTEELDAVAASVDTPLRPDLLVHTHPVKTAAEITDAADRGVTLFVVDCAGEVDKFAALDLPGVQVLVRLAFRNPAAASDLSSKFGVSPDAAEGLVRHAAAAGVRVAGFSYHVGSQLDDVAAFGNALRRTLELIDQLERSLDLRFHVLDIGGGFPVPYQHPVASIEEIAETIVPLLQPRLGQLTVIAEPGRYLVAEAATLLSRVTGANERDGQPWYFLDDGIYGCYSNVVFEGVTPLLLTEAEIAGADVSDTRPTTVAGPTCDSTDIVARAVPMPQLAVGDLIISPTLGAYTWVTSTRFNGRPLARVVVVGATDQPAQPSATPVLTA